MKKEHLGSDFDDFLREEGLLEVAEATAAKRVIEVKSKEEAVECASRCPASDNEVIEVRQVQEISDFPADVQEAAANLPELQVQSGQRKGS